jgi:hypothetical protein
MKSRTVAGYRTGSQLSSLSRSTIIQESSVGTVIMESLKPFPCMGPCQKQC